MLLEDLTDGLKMFVQQILLMILYHPLRENRSSATYDAGNSLCSEWNILHEHTRVLEESYEAEGTRIKVRASAALLGTLTRQFATRS